MSLVSRRQTLQVIEKLRFSPFSCTNVYLYVMESAGGWKGLTEASSRLFGVRQAWVESLLNQDLIPGWAGNIKEERVEPGSSILWGAKRFGQLGIIVTKQMNGPNELHTWPINKPFLDALEACIAPIFGWDFRDAPLSFESGSVLESPEFTEAIAASECVEVGRRFYGSGSWFAIKGKQIVAQAESERDIELEIERLQVPPPVLIVPPERLKTIQV